MKKDDVFNETFCVSEFVYTGFMDTFNDRNPLHTNEDFARTLGFTAKVMHGNILNGFLSYFIGECLPDKNVFIVSQSISYNAPVYLNDEVNLKATVTDVHESVKVVDFKYIFRKTDGDKVASGNIRIGYR